MAGVLSRFERRLEGAVTGAFARAFRSAVQPVEIAAELQREIDNSTSILSRDRILVPNDFTVHLSPADYERLTPFGSTLADELATLVREHVDEQRYTLAGGLAITFERDDTLRTGRFTVDSRTNATVHAAPSERLTDTSVRSAAVVLEVGGMKHPVSPPGLVIGRGSDSDLKIDDPGISRRHARIHVGGLADAPAVAVEDLGSTNGVVVDGRRVESSPVSDGSQIRLGNTTLTVRIPSSTR